MNEKVPFLWHEMKMAKMERRVRNLWLTALFLVTAFVCSNVGWIAYFFWLR